MEQFGWKSRKSESEGDYEARLLSHEANTSLEYGEKTWTTAQTVRDLMQNHLDAETEAYYNQVATRFFDEETLAFFKSSEVAPEQKVKFQQLLYSLYLYSKHTGDMTDSARQDSLQYLETLASDTLSTDIKEGMFNTDSMKERLDGLSEGLPKVSFRLRDSQTGEDVGWIPYETLRDEEKYQETVHRDFRYVVEGMKMVDQGSGYDSQLSSVFVSSKTDKKHTRGKFGEGSKMSELHLLRANASLKMRSEYNVTSVGGESKSRTWQTRPHVSDEGRLVQSGVEIQKAGSNETGSTAIVMFEDAKDSFKKEFQKNIDPRVGGLAKNIAYYASDEIVYPNALSDAFTAGINIHGDGEIQYVQGIRVELSDQAFGYSKPWYSYDFLDSSIIAGRDRNEIKSSITDKIKEFWTHNDNPELLRQLVSTALFDGSKSSFGSKELDFLQKILGRGYSSYPGGLSKERLTSLQEIIDAAVLEFLHIVPGEPTVVLKEGSLDERTCDQSENPYDCRQRIRELQSTIKEKRYRVVYTKHGLDLGKFAERNSDLYEIVTLSQIADSLSKEKQVSTEREPLFEGEKEKTIRDVFAQAVERVGEFRQALGLESEDTRPLTFADPRDFRSREEVFVSYVGIKINSQRVEVETEDDRLALQRKLELLLLAEAGGQEVLKSSQRFLDTHIERLLDDSDSVLEGLPRQFSHQKDPEFLERFIGELERVVNTDHRAQKKGYSIYQDVVSAQLPLARAMTLVGSGDQRGELSYTLSSVVKNRFYFEQGTFTYFSENEREWRAIELNESVKVSEWQGLPVYQITDDSYFVPAAMDKGAVITKGEGKEREYFFNDGTGILSIEKHKVDYASPGGYGDVSIQPEGIVVRERHRRYREEGGYKNTLSEYRYYPQGVSQTEQRSLEAGREITAIPVEYGKDEWDNPVRVFQDIIQNHIDASPEGFKVELLYEVERDSLRRWVTEDEISGADFITAISFEDSGTGYAPSDIATLGASSKKSPLFAGKYGEGQKMVAAAALRNGLQLQYESSFTGSDGTVQSWQALTEPYVRTLVLDGKEVQKSFISFTVEEAAPRDATASRTVIKLPEQASAEQLKKWNEWLAIVDPREVDGANHRGLSRYVRQIRKDDTARTYTVGGVTLLLDEPGAVYENGLRINADAEQKRGMAFGYDVPEIVTTRERNSFDVGRLEYYARHLFRHTSDARVIEVILTKLLSNGKYKDLSFSDMSSDKSAGAYWAEVAQQNWPGKLVYSQEKIRKDMQGDQFGDNDAQDRERQRKALELSANLVHFDKNDLVNVSAAAYDSFSSFFPTAQDAVKALRYRTVETSDDTKRELATLVVGATRMFDELHDRLLLSGREDVFGLRNIERELAQWGNSSTVLQKEGGVGLAPMDSGFHGLASDGVILNEGLFLEGNKKKIGAVVLHEMNHILTNFSDYTEGFVGVMYELAQLLLEKRGGKIGTYNPARGEGHLFDGDEDSSDRFGGRYFGDEEDEGGYYDWLND